ncbi:MAG TPA: DinB family protein, partial [Terracidiphilus sp.]|nr:DinB family protein [Terracidiphilus sp.]
MTATPADVPSLFLEHSRQKLLEQYWPRLKSCVESLTEEQLWWRPNEACNSIGNLLLHLNGSVRQWLVASFNRLEDRRNRPAEFNLRELISASALLSQLG